MLITSKEQEEVNGLQEKKLEFQTSSGIFRFNSNSPAKSGAYWDFTSREQMLRPLSFPRILQVHMKSTFFSPFKLTHQPSPHLIITDTLLVFIHSLIILKQTLQISNCPPIVSLFLSNERAILKNARTTDLPFFCGF